MPGRLESIPWRSWVPRRRGWLCLLAAPTSALMVVALVVTVAAKAMVLRDIETVSAWPVRLLACIGLDAFVYLGLAALYAVVERRSRARILLTLPLALLAILVAGINAYYLYVAGEQLTWEAVRLGLDRWDDTWMIASEGMRADAARLTIVALVLAGGPLLAYLLLRRKGRTQRDERAVWRARSAAPPAVFGLLLYLLVPAADDLSVRRLAGNAALTTYWTWITAEELVPEGEDGELTGERSFAGYGTSQLVSPTAIDALRRAPAANVLVVVLESTRFDATSLAPVGERLPVETPTLAKLAKGALTATRARAVLPHTTKSLVSILCGRYPTMQKDLVEILARFQVQCLPAVVREAGYATAFFQSSVGAFEERPRLAAMMGFEDFAAWEEIQGEGLGYLASDDESMVPAFAGWLDENAGRPFFATVLTSAVHHPYRLSRVARQRARERHAATSSDRDRYLRLVEAEDALLAGLLAALDERGLRRDTLIVVVGDHGEGFGAKGVRQHDNNFYEEGLRVPFVIAGKGVEPATLEAPVSLLDVTPTVLGLLGLSASPTAELPGLDLRANPPGADRRHVFSCWFDQRCEGVLIGLRKLVHRPVAGESVLFDLERDADERLARPVPAELEDELARARADLDAHRTGERWPGPAHEAHYGEWDCPPMRPCRHPATARFRVTAPDDP